MHIHLRASNATIQSDDGGYTWLFPSPVVLGEPNDRIEVQISSYQYYSAVRNVSARTLSINGTPITIPDANYSAYDLLDLIRPALPAGVTLEFEAPRMGFVFTSTTTPITVSGTLLRLMGFTTTSYTDTTIRSERLCNLGGVTHLVVESSLLTTNVQDADLASSVLDKIPIEAGYSELVTYRSETFSTMAEHEITHLTIRVLDDSGVPVDFGDTDWTMTLYFRVTPTGTYQPLSRNYLPAVEQNDGAPNELPADRTQIPELG